MEILEDKPVSFLVLISLLSVVINVFFFLTEKKPISEFIIKNIGINQ